MNAINVLGKAAYAAPLVPSILVGWAVFEATEGMPLYLRILAAVAFSVAFEGAGVLAGALRDRRFLVAYIALGIVTLIALELFHATQMVVGICALLVAALVYTVMGERERQTQTATEKIDTKRENANRRHELKLAEIEANKQIAIASASGKKVESGERKVSTNSVSKYGNLSRAEKLALLDMTGGEIGNMYGMSRQAGNGMKRKAKAELNGVAR